MLRQYKICAVRKDESGEYSQMKILGTRTRRRFLNLKLRTKILFLVVLTGGLTLAASFVGFSIIQNTNNRVLYGTIAASLNSGSTIISDELKNIEALSNTIVSNKYIRKGLYSIADGDISEVHVGNVDNTVSSILTEYHNNHPEIRYILLKNDEIASSSYLPGSRSTSESTIAAVQSSVRRTAGYPQWIVEFASNEGVFLARDCLRIRNLKQEILGTLIISVNMEKLVRSSGKSSVSDLDLFYIVTDGENQIYHSKTLTDEEISAVSAQSRPDGYQIIRTGNQRYFTVQSKIESTGWQFICAVPYSSITHSLQLSRRLSIGMAIITFLIAIYIAIRIVSSITDDFSELIYKMNAFGQDESHLPVSKTDYSERCDEAAVLHNQFDAMTVQIQELIRQNYLNEIANKEAQLQSLQAQVNPHFLYNTLDCIYWRAKLIGDEQIFRMTESLGALLRASLSRKRMVTLEEECEIVHNYVTIQRMRFDEERLEYREEIPDCLKGYLIPRMTIQPLVDNAVNYAMEMITETCYIEVRVEEKGGLLCISVENNGSQFEDDLLNKLQKGTVVARGIGIGLLNIDRRIKLIYGSKYGLILSNPDEGHALAEIVIPERRTEQDSEITN